MSQKSLQELDEEIEDLYYDLFDAQNDHDWILADRISAEICRLEREEQSLRASSRL